MRCCANGPLLSGSSPQSCTAFHTSSVVISTIRGLSALPLALLFDLSCCLDEQCFFVEPSSVLYCDRQGGVTRVLWRWMCQQRCEDNRDFGCLAPCLPMAISWAPWETSHLLEDRCVDLTLLGKAAD